MKNSKIEEAAEKFKRLLEIMDTLRGESGCPWDLEQTHSSLTPYVVEEAHEVVETIEHNQIKKLPEELGDLMLQIVFHSRIGKEEGTFDIGDVLDNINQKMIRRHPHIFGDVKADTPQEVIKNWEEIKMKEKGEKGEDTRKSLLDGIPKSMPALLFARRLQERASGVGFDWKEIDGVIDKIEEEMEELRQAIHINDKEHIADELGDLLFAAVNIGRWMEINPEEALRRTCKKFIRRFQSIENHAKKSEKKLHEMNLDEMEEIWQKSKIDEENTSI